MLGRADVARYFTGMNRKGGAAPASVKRRSRPTGKLRGLAAAERAW